MIQHIPILRDTWVVSLHGLAKTTWDKGDQATPFYLLPSLGGGSSLRGFSSFRFTDRNSLLLQAEWRIIANRFFESAVFYDAGKVAARTSDLDLNHLKSDYGFGVRFHAPLATVLRVDVARSNEGTRLVFAASPSFLTSRATVMRTKILTFVSVVSMAVISGFGSVTATSPRFYRDDPIFASPSRRMPAGAALSEVDLMYELTYNLFALSRTQAHRPARAERQYDRRSSRLELVHQPHRDEGTHHRRACPWSQRRAPAGSLALGHLQGEDLRRPRRHHGQGRQR